MTAESSDLPRSRTWLGRDRGEARVVQETGAASSWRDSRFSAGMQVSFPAAGHPRAADRLRDGKGLYPSSFLPLPRKDKTDLSGEPYKEPELFFCIQD